MILTLVAIFGTAYLVGILFTETYLIFVKPEYTENLRVMVKAIFGFPYYWNFVWDSEDEEKFLKRIRGEQKEESEAENEEKEK